MEAVKKEKQKAPQEPKVIAALLERAKAAENEILELSAEFAFTLRIISILTADKQVEDAAAAVFRLTSDAGADVDAIARADTAFATAVRLELGIDAR